ncbi:MAG TPA: DUF6599 family protein [Anaeromyxobacteraceae bacterium]|nr:DUF6599 family protein [Anaeromyxobacteraceae bacterium]
MALRPRRAHVFLLLALAAAVGLVLERGRRVRDDPAAVLLALRQSQGPRLPAAAGATLLGEPARYDRERLYELVDGAADAFLARGFERCVAATFGVGPVEVAAEAHRFATEAGARAQLEAERPRRAAAVPGLAAVSDGSVLLSVAGRDLLKLTALSTGPAAGEALAALAAAWEGRAP